MLYCPCTHSSHGLIQEIILPPPPGLLAALGTAGWQRSLTPLHPHLDSVPKLAPPRQDEICSHCRLQLPGQVIIRIRAAAGTPTAQNTEQRSQISHLLPAKTTKPQLRVPQLHGSMGDARIWAHDYEQ